MNAPKCIKCGKKTDILCTGCEQPICAKHSYAIRRRLFCPDCFIRERNIGMLKGWAMLTVLIGLGIVILFY